MLYYTLRTNNSFWLAVIMVGSLLIHCCYDINNLMNPHPNHCNYTFTQNSKEREKEFYSSGVSRKMAL